MSKIVEMIKQEKKRLVEMNDVTRLILDNISVMLGLQIVSMKKMDLSTCVIATKGDVNYEFSLELNDWEVFQPFSQLIVVQNVSRGEERLVGPWYVSIQNLSDSPNFIFTDSFDEIKNRAEKDGFKVSFERVEQLLLLNEIPFEVSTEGEHMIKGEGFRLIQGFSNTIQVEIYKVCNSFQVIIGEELDKQEESLSSIVKFIKAALSGRVIVGKHNLMELLKAAQENKWDTLLQTRPDMSRAGYVCQPFVLNGKEIPFEIELTEASKEQVLIQISYIPTTDCFLMEVNYMMRRESEEFADIPKLIAKIKELAQCIKE